MSLGGQRQATRAEIDPLGEDVTHPPQPSLFAEPAYLNPLHDFLWPREYEGGQTGELERGMAEYEWRLGNTRDAIAAQAAWQRGDKQKWQSILENNPNVGVEVSGPGAGEWARKLGVELNSSGSFSAWGREAAGFLFAYGRHEAARGQGGPRYTQIASLGGAGLWAQETEYTDDACGQMAANAQRIADEALGATSGNTKKALKRFDNNFGRFYAGYPMNSGLNIARLGWTGGGGPNRQAPRFLWGQTGFRREFMETDSLGNLLEGHHDQTHHFAAMFSGGINRYRVETLVHNLGDNDGDQRLTNAAYDLGATVRKDPNKLREIGNLIRNTICDQRRR